MLSSTAPTEANQQVKESPAETQTTESPAEKPAESTEVDVIDGDPTASTQTSVETLNDVLNENNSNNNAGTVKENILIICKYLQNYEYLKIFWSVSNRLLMQIGRKC